MGLLLKHWVEAPKLISKHKYIDEFIRVFRINKLLKGFHIRTKKWILESKYGQKLREEKIGQLTVQGVQFSLYDPDLVYISQAKKGGTYEPAVTYHLKTLIKDKKCCFLDIGSFFGFYSVFVGSLNKNCEIHSFEPNAEYSFITNYNIKLNNLDVKSHRVALSDETAEIRFSDRSMKVKEGAQSETVKAIPFDDLAQKENIHPEIVKLDVHGSEGKCLFGMKKALKNDINHLYLELHPNELLVGYSMKEIIDLLLESGFFLYEIHSFRFENSPDITKITDRAYENLINQNKWTQEQIDRRRMIFATKKPEEFDY